MTGDEPLNVQCARALGWTGIEFRPEYAEPRWWGLEPIDVSPYRCRIDPYGDDTPEGWACTGPLLSEYGIELDGPLGSLAEPEHQGLYAAYAMVSCTAHTTCALRERGHAMRAHGAHYCEAIARLVVRLAELGKLEKVKR